MIDLLSSQLWTVPLCVCFTHWWWESLRSITRPFFSNFETLESIPNDGLYAGLTLCEGAERSAAQEVFPNPRVRGCLFHSLQTCRRRWVSLFGKGKPHDQEPARIFGQSWVQEKLWNHDWVTAKDKPKQPPGLFAILGFGLFDNVPKFFSLTQVIVSSSISWNHKYLFSIKNS